jgi:hypothetical protein
VGARLVVSLQILVGMAYVVFLFSLIGGFVLEKEQTGPVD